MDQNFQTSFIPRKPIVNERVVSSRPVGILLVASILILFTVLLATGGLYIYKGVLTKNIAAQADSLNLAQSRFEPDKINELQTLDKRLRAATEIMSNHINITPVFDALDQVTLKSIRYTKFSYDLGSNSSSSNVVIKMSGQAQSYKAIALQADMFSSNTITNKNFIDPVFSNLTLDQSGNVLFDLEFSVDSSFVNYQKSLAVQS